LIDVCVSIATGRAQCLNEYATAFPRPTAMQKFLDAQDTAISDPTPRTLKG
jgi:hypothetical protein